MKAVIQRVLSASVAIDGKEIGSINQGLLVLLGISQEDTSTDLEYLIKKTVGLRIFKDEHANMNLSIEDVGGEALVVSQFTLCADTRKGRRPALLMLLLLKLLKALMKNSVKNFKMKMFLFRWEGLGL